MVILTKQQYDEIELMWSTNSSDFEELITTLWDMIELVELQLKFGPMKTKLVGTAQTCCNRTKIFTTIYLVLGENKLYVNLNPKQ